MKYNYKGRSNGEFNLTDVSELKYKSTKKKDDLYKIVWAMNDDLKLGIDGHLTHGSPVNFSDKNINEIAEVLRFQEVSHFSKFFKHQVSMSPTEYKASNQFVKIYKFKV